MLVLGNMSIENKEIARTIS